MGLLEKRMNCQWFWLSLLLLLLNFGDGSPSDRIWAGEAVAPPQQTAKESTPRYDYRIVNVYPHDRGAFTQGLVFSEGFLYESTGLYRYSTVRKVDPKTGKILKQVRLPDEYFGEGLTVVENRMIQLTWRANVGFVYDMDSFEKIGGFDYSHEGWGICYDGVRLIVSDGTHVLRFYDPLTYTETGAVDVFDDNGPVEQLNELEYIDHRIYANVWKTDKIAVISPATGKVEGWIELTGLLNFQDLAQPVDVLNGIAYDEKNHRIFITGKLWPKLFEITVMAGGKR